jgi:hypothetical protein
VVKRQARPFAFAQCPKTQQRLRYLGLCAKGHVIKTKHDMGANLGDLVTCALVTLVLVLAVVKKIRYFL